MTRHQHNRKIWTPYLGAGVNTEKDNTTSKACKGKQGIPSERSGSKGRLANCPQNHFRRLQSASLKTGWPYRMGHQDQINRYSQKEQADYILSPRSENNYSSWLPRQAQRSKNKALLITAIIVISIVPSCSGHGPVPHCVSQCANRRKEWALPKECQVSTLNVSYKRNEGDKEVIVSQTEERCLESRPTTWLPLR